jgi:glycosyltransferase involved in cell wall biosynthesis
MIGISLCMMVKNESEVIYRCLDSVKDIVDEIIIVDTGSTDNTKSIVRRYTDKIFDFEWIDDFSSARNFSFNHASMDYILWVDADDVLLDSDRQKLLQLKQTLDPSVDAVSMHYHLAFDSEGNLISSLRRNRLVKRLKGFQWHGAVHEYLAVGGHILNSDIAITHRPIEHDSDRNLRIYERRLAAGETFTPRDLFYYANECLDHKNYEQAIEYYLKFLNSRQGWVEDNITACGKLADCYNHLGDIEQERKYTLKSFEYDTPRAEFCCRLGYGFMQNNEWQKAIFWYKLATQLEKPKDSWGFFNEVCWTWLPHLQLCVCYDRLGEYKLAYEHNEIARKCRPNDEQMLHNKKYLESVINK